MNLNDSLSTAILNGDLAEVKHYLASGALVSEDAILKAIWTNRVDIVRVLIWCNARLIKTLAGHFSIFLCL